MTTNLNELKVRLTVFEQAVSKAEVVPPTKVNVSYFGKIILELTKNDIPIMEPIEILTPVATPRDIIEKYENVNKGTWMGSSPTSFMDITNNRVMGIFSFKRILPLYSDDKRNKLITGVEGVIVIHPDTTFETFQNVESQLISLNEPNILIEVISINQRQHWLMDNEGKTLEEVIAMKDYM